MMNQNGQSADDSTLSLMGNLLRLSDTLRAMARELISEESGADMPANASELVDCLDDSVLAAIAVSIYRARQRRQRYFGSELFGEPAWDLLLELFANRARGLKITTTSACLATGVPQTTALRMLEKLEREGLVRRFRDRRDRRLMLTELTDSGFQLVRKYIADGVSREEMPPPDGLMAA